MGSFANLKVCLCCAYSLHWTHPGAQVRQELQGRIEELRVYPELLGEAEQSLLQCQENLRRLERQCSEKSESIKQLQFKVCNASCCHQM